MHRTHFGPFGTHLDLYNFFQLNLCMVTLNSYVFFLSFLGISAMLPITSYVKMIDIWMIFTMIFPLLVISLHTYKEKLQLELQDLTGVR